MNDKFLDYPILLKVKENLELSGHAENTINNYISGIHRFLEFTKIDDINNLSLQHFRDYLIYLNSTDLNKLTINCNNSYIRYFYQAILLKDINPFVVPRIKSSKKDIDFLTHSQILNLLSVSSSDSKWDCIIKFGLCCGLRSNEILSLKVSDIDISSMTVFVSQSKRNKSRYVPLDQTIYLALKRYSREYHLKKDDLLFTFNHAKTKSNNETLRRNFYFFRDKANIPSSFTFHCLRHTFAINYLNAGGQLIHLKYLLGHGSIETTTLYLHLAYNLNIKISSPIDALLGGGSHV